MIREGDCVKRISYGGDIVFVIKAIHGDMAILEGVEYRLIADAPLSDLELVESYKEDTSAYRMQLETTMRWIEQVRQEQVRQHSRGDLRIAGQEGYFEVPGKVLHLDGDVKYLQKSMQVYRRLRIPVNGFHMEERLMADALYKLLPRLKPDIVVITGHDAILKDRIHQKYSLDSYKNSLHFIRAVRVARQYERNRDSLSIVAGACQSHFEALLQAGANFASSPGRVMIHALDPVQIASRISYTSIRDTVDMEDIIKHTVSGLKGIGGIESKGSYRVGLPLLLPDS